MTAILTRCSERDYLSSPLLEGSQLYFSLHKGLIGLLVSDMLDHLIRAFPIHFYLNHSRNDGLGILAA